VPNYDQPVCTSTAFCCGLRKVIRNEFGRLYRWMFLTRVNVDIRKLRRGIILH
jgi:hypothetical protein